MSKFWIQTFGCQMNVHDSDRMHESLVAAGYQSAERAHDADLIVMNTCSVREKAEHKLLSALGRLKPLKEQNPDLVVAVAGCVAQQEGEKLLKRAEVLDIVVGPDNLAELPRLVENVRVHGYGQVHTVFDVQDPHFNEARPDLNEIPVSTFVTVMKGCDERCTFCIVPFTRGPERYRSAQSIVDDVQRWARAGVREITLLGQTVNSWFENPESKQSEFANLLRRIAREVPELQRLRYTSPHPRHLTEALIAAHADLAVLPRHVHMPVQSGSNAVLKRMLRRYTREEYLARLNALRKAAAGLTVATDIIVGFPGESEQDFQDTLSLVEEADFAAGFAFMYSPRPYTPALKLKNDVSNEVKQDRLNRLLQRLNAQQQRHLNARVGTRVEVLVEKRNEGYLNEWTGRSERNEIVHIRFPPHSAAGWMGHMVETEIEAAQGHSLKARFIRSLSDPTGAQPKYMAPKRRLPLVEPQMGAAQ